MNKKSEIGNEMSGLLDVTVCLMSFKRPHYLSEAIDSVLAQSSPPKEFIIFDNGSGEEVEKTVDRYKDRGVVIEGIDVPRNADWNFERAIKKARTKYLNIMHDDDRMCPDFIEKQVCYLENHPDVAGVFCNCHLIDSTGMRNGIMKPYAVSRLFKSGAEVATVYARGSCLPFPTGVYRTAMVRQVSVRKQYGKVADVVFMCDLADIGAIGYRRLPLYEYRIHSGQDSAYFPDDLLAMRNKFIFEKMCLSRRHFHKMHWAASRLYALSKRSFLMKKANSKL